MRGFLSQCSIAKTGFGASVGATSGQHCFGLYLSSRKSWSGTVASSSWTGVRACSANVADVGSSEYRFGLLSTAKRGQLHSSGSREARRVSSGVQSRVVDGRVGGCCCCYAKKSCTMLSLTQVGFYKTLDLPLCRCRFVLTLWSCWWC